MDLARRSRLGIGSGSFVASNEHPGLSRWMPDWALVIQNVIWFAFGFYLTRMWYGTEIGFLETEIQVLRDLMDKARH